MHRKSRTRAVGEIFGAGVAAMKFRDEPDDVKTQSEVRAAGGARAGLPERLEQTAAAFRRKRRTGVIHLQYGFASLSPQSHDDRCARGTEIDRVVDQLVEHLHDEIWRPV